LKTRTYHQHHHITITAGRSRAGARSAGEVPSVSKQVIDGVCEPLSVVIVTLQYYNKTKKKTKKLAEKKNKNKRKISFIFNTTTALVHHDHYSLADAAP
jgi:hypothetical protein